MQKEIEINGKKYLEGDKIYYFNRNLGNYELGSLDSQGEKDGKKIIEVTTEYGEMWGYEDQFRSVENVEQGK